jgi:hypothetical protein
MLRVTMSVPGGRPLSGILGSGPGFSTTPSMIPLWDLAIVEAAKHAAARGEAFQGAIITRNYAGQPSSSGPEVLLDLTEPISPPTAPITMSREEVMARVKTTLPSWAAGASIEVLDDAASERVVRARLTTPAAAFRAIDPDQLLRALFDSQVELAPKGAKIGRVTIQVTDPVSNDPVYTAAGDAFFGFASTWRSPLIRGFNAPLAPLDRAADTASTLPAVP